MLVKPCFCETELLSACTEGEPKAHAARAADPQGSCALIDFEPFGSLQMADPLRHNDQCRVTDRKETRPEPPPGPKCRQVSVLC